MAAETAQSVFEHAVSEFDRTLDYEDRWYYKRATEGTLLTGLRVLQELHEEWQTTRGMKNPDCLLPLIRAMDQLGKVIEEYVNAQTLVAYIWGPMALTLQKASRYPETFNELLEMCEQIGHSFHLLVHSEELFRTDTHMLHSLILMYKDVFELHRHAFKYLSKPPDNRQPEAAWKSHKSRLDSIVRRIQDNGELIDRHATLSYIKQFHQDRADRESERELRNENEQNQRLRVLYDWLHSPNVENDQDHYSKIRQEYPETGRWLLDVPVFKEWFDPKVCSIPNLLWITGIPGSGKTILASFVVEAARALPSPPTVLFFYCKNGDKERDNFNSIGRTFLIHLLSRNKDTLLPSYYESFSASTETTLRTQSLIEDLLRTSIMKCPNVYIVLDGIDECDRKERRSITKFFRGLVESPPFQSGHARCLFLSQHDGIALKDFSHITTLKIEREHNSADIEAYCKSCAQNIQNQLDLTEYERDSIAKKVLEKANGMFLLARLICSNLINQTSLDDLELELEDEILPQELVKEYTRITASILIEAPRREREASQKLLTWLVCARRPLQWHEIQAAKSINLQNQTVELKRYQFRVAAKDLCGPLVEVGQDGTVELVHSTARAFLISELHVKRQLGELQMATLCLSYLNMPGLGGHESREELKKRVPYGYFAFLDYATTNWIYHLERGLDEDVLKHEDVFRDLSKCLGLFVELHFRRPKMTNTFQISQYTVQRLEPFKEFAFHPDLQLAVTSAREQLKPEGEMQWSEAPLDLRDIVMNIRSILEEEYDLRYRNERKDEFERMYGKRIFKCPKLSCDAFHNGFSTSAERNRHHGAHGRPFRCTVSGCPQEHIVFSTYEDLERHTSRTHIVQSIEKVETPSGAVSEPTISRPPGDIVETTIASEQDSIFSHLDSVLAKEGGSLTSISAITSVKRDFNESTAGSLENLRESQQDEIESVVSDELDIGSAASSSRTETEMHAISLIAFYLTRTDEFVILCKSALRAMSQERFSNNLRRLLKPYCIRLQKESCNRVEEITAHFLRKRTNRISIAQKIVQIVQDDGSQARAVERTKELPDSKKNISTWLSKLVSTEFQNTEVEHPKESSSPEKNVDTWLKKSNDHEFSDDSGWTGKLLEGDNGGDITNSDHESNDSESSSASISESTSTENDFPDIKSLEDFLRRGQPFQNLLIDLRILRLPGPLREIIDIVPKQLIYLSEKNDTSLLNRAQICLERYTGCRWDWWPMKPPLQPIKGGDLRLLWTLYGRCLQMAIPREQADLLSQILDRVDDHPQHCHCCFPKRPLVTWSTVLSRAKGMISLGHQNANYRPARSAPGASSEAAQRYTPAVLASVTASNTSTPAHMIQKASSSAEGTGETNNPPRFLVKADHEIPGCFQSLNVIFAVQGWRVSLELEEIIVADRPTDSVFFQKLRAFHRSHRPGLGNLFSPFRFGNCRFVKFEKMQPTIIRSSSEPALPDHYGHQAEYEYEPRPPGAKLPLIDQQQFWILLNECHHECWWSISPWHDCIRLSPRSSFLRKIPKRNNPSSLLRNESNDQSNDVAFGIEADYILSLRYLAFYHIVPIFLAFSFWAYWLVMHPGDLQNASVPTFTVLALAGTFWVLVGKRTGIS